MSSEVHAKWMNSSERCASAFFASRDLSQPDGETIHPVEHALLLHAGGSITPQMRRKVREIAEAMIREPGNASEHERLIGHLMISVIAHASGEPPVWSPARIDKVDRLINTTEFFVHLEDVRRAQPDWEPRELPDELVDDLYAALGRSAKLFARKAPAGITLTPSNGHQPIVANSGSPMVTVSGPVGELVLWMFGRQAHARIGYVGPDEAVDRLRTASFGL